MEFTYHIKQKKTAPKMRYIAYIMPVVRPTLALINKWVVAHGYFLDTLILKTEKGTKLLYPTKAINQE